MKYLMKVNELPTQLEEGVLYYDSTNDKVVLKATPKEDPDYVDLGLSSRLKWAKCNLGAAVETEYGKYFQWGDTVGYEGDEALAHSTWETAPFNNGSSSYNASAFAAVSGTVCPNGVLAPQYDAVSVATKGKAHMPTSADTLELKNETYWQWDSTNKGYYIYKVKDDAHKGKMNDTAISSDYNPTTDTHIFIPAAGSCNNGSLGNVGSYGYVWSSSLNSSNPGYAYCLSFDSSGVYPQSNLSRYFGFSVRGVLAQN